MAPLFGRRERLCQDTGVVIPYFTIPAFQPFPPGHALHWLGIQPFGVFMALGVFFGTSLARKFAEKNQLDDETVRWLAFRIIVVGFIICHFVNALFYEPHRLKEDPMLLIRIWEGISSYGGIFGATLAFLFFTRNFDKMIKLRWADWVMAGTVPGFMFGRIGCAIVHDHIGVATKSPLGVDFSTVDPSPVVHGNLISGVHHDLGLYEVPVLLGLWLIIFLVSRIADRKDGLITAISSIGYAIPRFFFEEYRFESTDPTYFGLTPAQYFSIFFVIVGLTILYRLYVAKKFTLATVPDLHKIEVPTGGAKPPGTSASTPKTSGSKKKKKKVH